MYHFVLPLEHAQAEEVHIKGWKSSDKPFLQYLIDILPKSVSWTCTSEKTTCDTDALDCKVQPKVVKAIKAIVNYRDFLQACREAFRDAVQKTDRTLAGMQATFNPSTKSEIGEKDSELFAAGLGMLGAAAGMAPGGQYASAIASIASSAITLFSPDAEHNLEAQFKGYTELLGKLNSSISTLENVLDQRINDIFHLKPPKIPGSPRKGGLVLGWNVNPAYVSNVISEGGFAVPVNPEIPKIKKAMETSLYSEALNYLWQKEKIIVLKISKKSLGEVDPCDPKQPDIMFRRDIKYCDKQGNMYVLQAHPVYNKLEIIDKPPSDHRQYAVAGFGNLGEYQLSARDVITSSWRNQGKISMNESQAMKVLEEYIKSGSSGPLTFYSLQTCDLDKIEKINPLWCRGKSGLDLAYCTMYGKLDGCRGLDRGLDEKGNKLEWPWDGVMPLP